MEPPTVELGVIRVGTVLAFGVVIRIWLFFVAVQHTAIIVIVKVTLLQDLKESLKIHLHAVRISDRNDIIAELAVSGKDIGGNQSALPRSSV